MRKVIRCPTSSNNHTHTTSSSLASVSLTSGRASFPSRHADRGSYNINKSTCIPEGFPTSVQAADCMAQASAPYDPSPLSCEWYASIGSVAYSKQLPIDRSVSELNPRLFRSPAQDFHQHTLLVANRDGSEKRRHACCERRAMCRSREEEFFCKGALGCVRILESLVARRRSFVA